MAAETDPKDERSAEPLLDDDSAGPLAELLFSSPVIGADGDSPAGTNHPDGSRLDEGSPNDHQTGGVDHGGNGQFVGESIGGEHSSATVEPREEDDPTGALDREFPGDGDDVYDSTGFESSNGHHGRHDFGSISPPVFPGTDSGDIPSIDDVRGVGDLAFEPDTSLSTIHAPDLGDGVADELAALFLPIEPAGQVDEAASVLPSLQPPEGSPSLPRTEPVPEVPSTPITQPAPIVSSASVHSQPGPSDLVPEQEAQIPIEPPPTKATSPVISVPPTEPIPLTEPATSTTSMNDVAGELKFSTEAGRPGELQWSTVVHEPGRSIPNPPAVLTPDRSLFQEPPKTGPGAVLRVEAGRPVSLPARNSFVSDSLIAASERRWFWGAVAGAVAVSCLVLGFVLLGLDRDDGVVDADAALAAVDATETNGAGRPSAGLSDDQQESPVSAQLTPTSGLAPAAPSVRPPGPTPPRRGAPPPPPPGGPVSSIDAPTTIDPSTTEPVGSTVTTPSSTPTTGNGSSTSSATTTTSDTSSSATSGTSSTTEGTSTSSSVTTPTTSGTSSSTEDTSSGTSPSSTPSP